MKKNILIIAFLLIGQSAFSKQWDENQKVSKKAYQKVMKKRTPNFIPYDQLYQLESLCENSIGLCGGVAAYYFTQALAGQASNMDIIYSMSTEGTVNGSSVMQAIDQMQTTMNRAYRRGTMSDFFRGMGITSSNYPLIVPSLVPSLTRDYDRGLGTDSRIVYSAINTAVSKIAEQLREHFARNPIGAALLSNTLFTYVGNSRLSQVTLGVHMTSIFRNHLGQITFFDPNVGFALFPDLDQLISFIEAYYLTENSSGNTSIFELPLAIRLMSNTSGDYGPNSQLVNPDNPVCRTLRRARRSPSPIDDLFKNTFCERRLVFKNLNYNAINIQLLLANARDYYTKLRAGEEVILTYDKGDYYYKGSKVQSIDLDDGAAPVGDLDKHDNMDFSWTDNNTITYKAKNELYAEVLIDNYKDLSRTQYREVRDVDGVDGGAKEAIISSYGFGNTQVIEVKRWGTHKMDVSKLKKLVFRNVSYDDIGERRIRRYGWDGWPKLPKGTVLKFDYAGNGVVKSEGEVLEQIDLYRTGVTEWYSGDEFNFNWKSDVSGATKELQYKAWWDDGFTWWIEPEITLIDFRTGFYGDYVDADGIYGYAKQMYIDVHVSTDEKTLYIDLHGVNQKKSKAKLKPNSENNDQSEGKEEMATRLFPNPASEILKLQFGQELPPSSKYSIYDMSGRLLKQDLIPADQQRIKVDVSQLNNGIYFIQINATERHKFIVSH